MHTNTEYLVWNLVMFHQKDKNMCCYTKLTHQGCSSMK